MLLDHQQLSLIFLKKVLSTLFYCIGWQILLKAKFVQHVRQRIKTSWRTLASTASTKYSFHIWKIDLHIFLWNIYLQPLFSPKIDISIATHIFVLSFIFRVSWEKWVYSEHFEFRVCLSVDIHVLIMKNSCTCHWDFWFGSHCRT